LDAVGFADCVLTAACSEGATACDGITALRTCVGGSWLSRSCAAGRCIQTPLGDDCNAVAATRTFSGQVRYEARGPGVDRRNWDSRFSAEAVGFLVLVVRGAQVIDVQRTDDAGRFSVQIPVTPSVDDRLLVTALGVDPVTRRVSYAVADPRLGAGERNIRDTGAATLDPRLWGWSWNVAGLPGSLLITEAMGSGAARVFDYLRYSYSQMRDFFGSSGNSLMVWVGLGTSWSCGACFSTVPVRAFDLPFESQVWLDGAVNDQGYWSDAVTAHEFGHWVMASYGRSPGEGGSHTLGVPTFPGQAWSEGWATFVSSDIRNNPEYVDRQDGSMFWFNIQTRRYSSGGAWNSPAPTRLLDRVDENHVASMLWTLSDGNVPPIYAALGADRARRAPFGRCYSRHVWQRSGSTPINVCATSESAPHFADYLDSLSCGGFSRAQIRTAIGAYPYPVDSPYCTAGVRPSTCAASVYPRCR